MKMKSLLCLVLLFTAAFAYASGPAVPDSEISEPQADGATLLPEVCEVAQADPGDLVPVSQASCYQECDDELAACEEQCRNWALDEDELYFCYQDCEEEMIWCINQC